MSESAPAQEAPPPSPPPQPPPQRAAPPPPPRYEDPPPQEPTHKRTPNDQIADLRAEAAQYRISLRRTEQERDDLSQRMADLQAQIEGAKTAATAPLQQKLARASERAVTLAIRAELMALGLQDEDLIHLHSKIPEAPKVAVNDEFEVTGAKELAAAYKKWKPDYFKKAEAPPPAAPSGRRQAPPAPAQSGGPEPSPAGDPGGIDVRKMDKAQYAAYKATLFRDLRNSARR